MEEGVTQQPQHIAAAAAAARRYQLIQYDRRQALLGTVGHRDFGERLSQSQSVNSCSTIGV